MTDVISGMVERATAISNEKFLPGELRDIKTTFFSNGYPAALISSTNTHAIAKPDEHVPRPRPPLLILPYYKGLGQQVDLCVLFPLTPALDRLNFALCSGWQANGIAKSYRLFEASDSGSV
ncbi:hypothetical protein M514_07238 [Trichuris suis]|uniref:Helix-turn-helix domain-containing protein n=1 Tax=Trichuris suis TaxID=68888 RepID=A0A085M3W3_9BILA|nr:hypothetical protein M513_07238 [Trichuris suis]KFD63308.1 hypothetical protein M514_07238 [Trichuris suis]